MLPGGTQEEWVSSDLLAVDARGRQSSRHTRGRAGLARDADLGGRHFHFPTASGGDSAMCCPP